MPTLGSSAFTWNEVKDAALPMAASSGVVAAGLYCFGNNREQMNYWKTVKTPDWMIQDWALMGPIDIATFASVGLAANMVYKHLPSTERNVALGLCGASMLVWAGTQPTFNNKKDVGVWAGATALMTAAFGATAAACYQIDETAGLVLLPLTAWLGYKALGFNATSHNH